MNNKNFSHQSNVFFGCSLFKRDFTAFVQRVSLPGISFSNIEASKMAVKFYAPGDTPTYNPLNVDILLDDKLELWKEIVQHFQRGTIPGVGDNNLVEFESFVHIFGEDDKSIMRLNFHHCLLENIGDVEYDSSSEDAELTLSLSINYAYYTFAEKTTLKSKKDVIKGYRQNAYVKHLLPQEEYNGR